MPLTLAEYLSTHKCQGFTPRPHYFQDGDFMEWYWSDEIAYAEPILVDGREVGAVMRGQETGHTVGVQIYGVARMVKDETCR